jgi:hypothetical protein
MNAEDRNQLAQAVRAADILYAPNGTCQRNSKLDTLGRGGNENKHLTNMDLLFLRASG